MKWFELLIDKSRNEEAAFKLYKHIDASTARLFSKEIFEAASKNVCLVFSDAMEPERGRFYKNKFKTSVGDIFSVEVDSSDIPLANVESYKKSDSEIEVSFCIRVVFYIRGYMLKVQSMIYTYYAYIYPFIRF